MNDASDWGYMSEGGRHALFAYQTTSKPLERWAHRLLRIDKSILTEAAHRTLCPRCRAVAPETKERTVDMSFGAMVHALLSPYIDPPDNIMLSWTFVADLHERTVCAGRIPRQRLSDWKRQDCCHSNRNDDSLAPVGYLLRDYRTFVSSLVPPTVQYPNTVLCWEFKPKAGYTAISPLVAASRHCKFTRSRFSLLQNVYSAGKLTRDWMEVTASSTTRTFQSSLYDPLDLFSGHVDRIRRALQQLVARPQNNLKLWMDGTKLVLATSIPESLDSSALWETLGKSRRMVDLVTHILYKENFLSNLLKLQKLDVIDADGAIKVYCRLVHLCNGDMDQADRLADTVRPSLPHKRKKGEALQELTAWNETLWPRPSIAPNLVALQREIETFQTTLQLKVPNCSGLNESRLRSLDIIGRLTCEECCYLLQAWLFSLTMSDLSFFVTLQPAAINDFRRNQLNKGSIGECIYLISRQQCDVPGRVALRVNEGSECWVAFDYEIKAIDFDRKPARKLRSRETKEMHFDVP